MSLPISKKRKFVANGLFQAELNEFFSRELAENGYAGLDIRSTAAKTEIIIKASNTRDILGEHNRRIKELTLLVQKRFGLADNSLALYAERVANRSLSATVQAESLKYKLTGSVPIRRACYGILRNTMEAGAKGCEIIVAGKIRGQRAKAMKFVDGLMIHSGDPVLSYIDSATKHVLLRQGVLGIKIKIMLPFDATGKTGPSAPLPDQVTIFDPKEEPLPTAPNSEFKEETS